MGKYAECPHSPVVAGNKSFKFSPGCQHRLTFAHHGQLGGSTAAADPGFEDQIHHAGHRFGEGQS